MLPHIHLLTGLILINLFGFHSIDISVSILIVIGSIIPDFDILVVNRLKNIDNHRNLFTHYPLFYFSLTMLFLVLDSVLSFLFFAAMIHTLLDVVDFEIMICAPISQRKFSILNVNFSKIGKDTKMVMFLRNYYTQSYVFLVELFVIFFFFLSVIFNN